MTKGHPKYRKDKKNPESENLLNILKTDRTIVEKSFSNMENTIFSSVYYKLKELKNYSKMVYSTRWNFYLS